MSDYIKMFEELEDSEFLQAGGKGGSLSRLIQKGFPVPDGFVIFPTAFDGSKLKSAAWSEIGKAISAMKKKDKNVSFAVRSSALTEDSAAASFAGEFETILDVRSEEAIRAAILQVQRSRESERVKIYSREKGIESDAQIAVLIQQLIRAEISGVLFTADPVNGNPFKVIGNYIYGLGEQLVSGEAEPFRFSISFPSGDYDGPDEMRKYARKLFRLAMDLEDEFGCPQDIEWAIAYGNVYLLQSRPITTITPYNSQTGEWNYSRMGDYAWVQQEVFPDVLTPATWSVFKNFQNMNIYKIPIMGNIHGRLYMNLSLSFKMFDLLNKSEEYMQDYLALTTGHDLKNVTISELPLSKWQILKAMLPLMVTMLPKQIRLMNKFDQIIEDNPEKCNSVVENIKNTADPHDLAEIWESDLFPMFWNLLQVQDKANEDYFNPYMSAKKDLYDLVGKETAENLLTKMTGQSASLASIRPLIELQRLANGEISPEEYEMVAGHRPAHENEVAEPRLYERKNWIEEKLASYREDPLDYISMAKNSKLEFEKIRDRFMNEFPKKSKPILGKLEKTLNALVKREIIRSEFTRSLGVIRQWYLEAGKKTKLGNDVFFLEVEEMISVLRGDEDPIKEISKRKISYDRQIKRPPYPFIISGNFNMQDWLNDENRRQDIFDSHHEIVIEEETGIIRGHPGSAGRIEGRVRIILSPTDGSDLKKGEILVAATTNVGWTPIFPRAAAVVTDVGAPLSHAAIIARELGIPAVVGTMNATARLKTGDKVLVDGSQGIVYIR